MFAAIASALSPIIGGLFAKSSADKAAKLAAQQAAFEGQQQRQAAAELNAQNIAFQREANAAMLADKNTDRELQREFAKSGIQWRMQDAKAAGIHPLAALGASGASYSPSALQVGVPGLTSEYAPTTSSAVPELQARGGQDLGRAIQATANAFQRDEMFESAAKSLQLRKMGLEGDLLASRIARLKQQGNPPMPATGRKEKNITLQMGGFPITQDKSTSSMEDWSDRYGDEGVPSWLIPPMIMWQDYKATTGAKSGESLPQIVSRSVMDALRWTDKNVKVFGQ